MEKRTDDVGAALERSPQKSLQLLTEEIAMSKSFSRWATKILKLKLYRIPGKV